MIVSYDMNEFRAFPPARFTVEPMLLKWERGGRASGLGPFVSLRSVRKRPDPRDMNGRTRRPGRSVGAFESKGSLPTHAKREPAEMLRKEQRPPTPGTHTHAHVTETGPHSPKSLT